MAKSGSFLKGILAGAAIGAVAGVLLAPKSGKETRAELAEHAKKMRADASKQYEKASKMVMEKIEELKKLGEEIDHETYKKLATTIAKKLEKDEGFDKETAKELKEMLKADWVKVQKTLSNTESK